MPEDNEWLETRDPCACYCTPDTVPDFEIWYQTKFGEGDWSDWTGGIDPLSVGSGNGFSLRAQFRYAIDAMDTNTYGMDVRFLTITSHLDMSPVTYSIGATFTLLGDNSTGRLMSGFTDYVELGDTGDALIELYLVGGPDNSGAGGALTGTQQAQAATKRGWSAYNGNTGTPRLFLSEAASGSYDGDELADVPARTYSGAHHFSSTTVGTFTDPSGAYSSTLSADLLRQAYAGPAPGDYRLQRMFGTAVESDTDRLMTRAYRTLSGTTGGESLLLSLTSEYTTAMLEDAVQDSLDAQLAGGSPGALSPGLFARHFMSPGETVLRRMESQVIISAVAPNAYLSPGSSYTLEVHWKKRVYNRRTGGVTESSESTSFSILVGAGTGAGGRPPDFSGGVPSDSFDVTAPDNCDVELVEFVSDPQGFYFAPFVIVVIPP
jgi:hypothetical protein